jgi:hypothetical protein
MIMIGFPAARASFAPVEDGGKAEGLQCVRGHRRPDERMQGASR